MSPRSMVEDEDFDYDLAISRKTFEMNSEEERQEAQLLDALSIVQSNESMTEEELKYVSGDENNYNSRSRSRGEIQVETVGIHTVDSIVTKDTANTQESTTCPSERSPARQCHGVETRTQHARINFFKSPSHCKEDVEMELKIPSNVFSHHTGSYHTGTEASSIGSLSTTGIEDGQRVPESDDSRFSEKSISQHENEVNNDMVGETRNLQHSTDNKEKKEKQEGHSLKDTKERLRVTREQWKTTKQALRENKQELVEVRDKAQTVKRELKNFNKEWESQQTLLRNKDKELERLRLIIADRTVQLTEKTGELSITKVALVASENGLSACKKQITTRNAELEKANGDLKHLKKALSDAKAELSRTKMQLEASAQRRRKFSNKAMRLLLGDSESLDLGKIPSLSRDDVYISSKEKIGDCDISPKRPPIRAKSWSFTHSGSCDAGEEAAADADTTDCPLPYGFISAASTGSKKEIGVQATGITTSTTQSSVASRRDRLIPRPTRSKSRDNFGEAIDGTNKKSLDTAEETATSSEDKLEDCSLSSLYFDSTSKAASMDAIVRTTTTTKNTETEDNDSGFYFDSASKTPSASGSARKSAFAETEGGPQMACTAASTNASTYGTADSLGFDTAFQTAVHQTTSMHSRNNSLVENRSIEITASAVSHLTDPTVSDASFSTPLLASQSQSSEDDSLVQKGKRWRALMKKIKDNGDDQEEEIESVLGSAGSDIDDASFYSLNPHENNRRALRTMVTGSILMAFFSVCSMTLAWWAAGLGVTYTGGVLNMSDSRSIVAGATVVLLLAFMALWNLVEQSWTRALASFFKSS